MDFKEIKGKKHYLYDSLDEYKLHHSQVVTNNWRKGGEDEWVLTDDGYVCQVLKLSKIGKNMCIRTLCGTFDIASKFQMLGEKGIVDINTITSQDLEQAGVTLPTIGLAGGGLASLNPYSDYNKMQNSNSYYGGF